MKKRLVILFTIAILAFFQSMAYFGVGIMMEEASHTCPISMVMSEGCVSDMGMASAVHHITVIKGMTQAIAVNSLLATLLAALVLAVLAPLLSRHFFSFSGLPAPAHRSRWRSILFSSRKKIIKWISLRNKCGDAILFGRT